MVSVACCWLVRGCALSWNEKAGKGEITVRPRSANCRVPIESEPVYVPVAAAANVSVNVMDVPGAMLMGAGGTRVMPKPAPVTLSGETATALYEVAGFATTK